MEPSFDVSFKHVPAAVLMKAEAQARGLSQLLGNSLTASDTLVAQRRLGEAVIEVWLDGGLIGLTDVLRKAADTTLVRHRPKPPPDKRQMTLFKEK